MSAANPWCVYILSNKPRTIYVGATNDLLHRVAEHFQKIRPRAFTAKFKFDRCVYYEFLASEADARAREVQIKGWTRAKKVALIQSVNEWWHDLTPDIAKLFR